ncbi:MAG TPA: universal stress protein, partial [Acetobacteraceae bacterium]
MELRDIIVLVDGSKAGEARLALAVDLARRAPGRLTGVGIIGRSSIVDAVPFIVGPGLGLLASGSTASEPGFEGVPLIELDERRFRSASGELAADWRVADYGETRELIELGLLADLMILGQAHPGEGASLWGFHPESVILAAGCPCLVAPCAGSFETIGKNVLVAWDDSREAARALRAAKPLLRGSESVTVIGVSRGEQAADKCGLSLDEVAARLTAGGIKARAEPDLRGGLKVADVLLNRASDLSADLLVTGSFHHSR